MKYFLRRHWVSKHFQDFEQDVNLRSQAIVFLEDITCSPNLLPSEHRAASQLLRLLVRDDLDCGRQHLENLLSQPLVKFKSFFFQIILRQEVKFSNESHWIPWIIFRKIYFHFLIFSI